MDTQYSESLVGDFMVTHAEDDSSITTEDRDENSYEEEQSSIGNRSLGYIDQRSSV